MPQNAIGERISEMRAYIEGQIEYLRSEIDDELKNYRSYCDGIRETAEKYFSEERVQGFTDGQHLSPLGLIDDTGWVSGQIDRANQTKIEIWGLYKRLRTLLEVSRELDKYEAPGTVQIDDAAMELCGNLRVAKMKAADLTMKKDLAERHFYEGKADAYKQALKTLGYTDEQIEKMLERG